VAASITNRRFVGPYLELCRDLAFVLEDSHGVCGYVLAALDSKEFYQRFKEEWLPAILKLYPKPPPSSQPSPEVVREGQKVQKGHVWGDFVDICFKFRTRCTWSHLLFGRTGGW